MTVEALKERVARLEELMESFARELHLAYEYIEPDAGSSLTKSRMILEKVLNQLYVAEMGREPAKPLLGNILLDNQFTRRLDRRVLTRMHSIRDMGNLGPHGEVVETSDAVRVLDDLCEVLDWYVRRYPPTPRAMSVRVPATSPEQTAGGTPRPRPLGPTYYVYVSRTKVDMLYSQISVAERRALGDALSMDAPSEVGQRSQSDGLESAIAKARIVCEFLASREMIGTVDEPKSYFRGELRLRWGPYGGRCGGEFAFFVGATNRTIVGMGGSPRSVVGGLGRPVFHASSALPPIVTVLANSARRRSRRQVQGDDDSLALDGVAFAMKKMRGPAEMIEFVARTDLHDRSPTTYRLLGSPIYAALVDSSLAKHAEATDSTPDLRKPWWRFW